MKIEVCKCEHGNFLHKNSTGRCSGIKTIVYNPLKDVDIFADTSPCECNKFTSTKTPKKQNKNSN